MSNIALKKRSLQPSDPPLTWEEMNENLQKIEDALNELKNGKIDAVEKAAVNGIATLGEDCKLPMEQLPDIIDGGNFY